MSEKTYIIAIAGPSCAGKTETSKSVARLLNAHVIGLDSYYRDLSTLSMEERTRFNFDEPASLDHQLLIEHLHRHLGREDHLYPGLRFRRAQSHHEGRTCRSRALPDSRRPLRSLLGRRP